MIESNCSFAHKCIWLGILLSSLIACAKIVSPTGGERDTIPPSVLESTPPINSTQFSGNEIIIEFDEYIKLQNENEILLSPFMKTPPKFKLKGKKLIVAFEEPLLDARTYQIQFGESIQDLNESNKLENFAFVFSTGEKVDSFKLDGNVVFAENGEKAKDIWVGLYPESADTLFIKEAPLYIAKTDENGNYSINHIAEGAYEIVALEDKNANFFFDLPNEKIAFIDSLLVFNRLKKIKCDLFLFGENLTNKVLKVENIAKGINEVVLEKDATNVTIQYLGSAGLQDSIIFDLESNQEKLMFWSLYENTVPQSYLLLEEERVLDTIEIKANIKNQIDSLIWKNNLRVSKISQLDYQTNLEWVFNYPIKSVNLSTLYFKEDSIFVKKDSLPKAQVQNNKCIFEYKWKAGSEYHFLLPPNSITDWWGQNNQDSIKAKFKVLTAEDYGSLKLQLLEQDSTINYFYELRNSQDQLLSKGSCNDSTLVLSNLKPGKVSVLVVADLNDNQKWDSGNYLEGKQAEKIFLSKQKIEIKKNWEVLIEMIIGK